jgi:CheY-like chemotaxis protein
MSAVSWLHEREALVVTGYNRIVIKVDPVLRDLVPAYLSNRREDIDVIKAALDRGDFGTISRIGHNMRGSGTSFGFDGVSEVGTGLETAAKAGKRVESARLVRVLEDYLSRIDLMIPERELAKPEAERPAAQPVAGRPAGREASAGSGAEVLVVDDQEMNAAIISRYLTKEGYKVSYLASGDEALAAIDQGLRPALILLDVVMDGTDGFEVCRRIKANPATCSIPVVLVTSFDSRREFIQGWASGADDVLAKPVQRNELVMRARSLVDPGATQPVLEDEVPERSHG